MTQVNIYLNFNGNTEEAFEFYRSVFGGEFGMLQRFGQSPVAGQVPEQFHNKIMHVELKISEHCALMGTEAMAEMGHPLTVGNNVSISLNTDSKEESDKLFNALSVGGNIEMPIADMFWGAYFGALTDKFGIKWMINYQYPKA